MLTTRLMTGAAALAVWAAATGPAAAQTDQGNPNVFPATSNNLNASVVPGASCTGAGMVTIINLSSAVLYNNPTAPAYTKPFYSSSTSFGAINADNQTQVVGGLFNGNNTNGIGMSVQDGVTSDLGLPLAVGPGKPRTSTAGSTIPRSRYSYSNMFGISVDPTAQIDPANTLPIAAYPLITTFNKGTTPQSDVQNATGYQQYMGYSLGTNMFLGIPYCSAKATTAPAGWSASVDQTATQCPAGSTQQTAVWQLGLMNVTNPPNNAQYLTYNNSPGIFARVMNAMSMVASVVSGFFDGGVQFAADMIGAVAGGASSFQKNTNISIQTRPPYYGQTYMSIYTSFAADYDGNVFSNAGTQSANGLFTSAASNSQTDNSGISNPFGATPPPNAFAIRFSTAQSGGLAGTGQSTTVMLQTMADDSAAQASATGSVAGSMFTCPAGWLMTIWDSADFDSCVTGSGACALAPANPPSNPFN